MKSTLRRALVALAGVWAVGTLCGPAVTTAYAQMDDSSRPIPPNRTFRNAPFTPSVVPPRPQAQGPARLQPFRPPPGLQRFEWRPGYGFVPVERGLRPSSPSPRAIARPSGPSGPSGPGRAPVTVPTPTPTEQAAVPPVDERPPPPYKDELFRLAELLGSLHYLRALCGADEGQIWRDRMDQLIRAEDPGEEERRQIVGRFNHGYSSLADVYSACTPSAVAVNDRYVAEGAKLTAEITTRFGR